MFWEKKPKASTVTMEPPAKTEVSSSGGKDEAILKETVQKPIAEKLSGPRPVPGLVAKYLTNQYKISPDFVQLLMAVIRKRQADSVFDCHVFDQAQADASRVIVKDYTSLNQHPELVLYEGWYNEANKHVELSEKKKVDFNIPLFTETEILSKIEALNELGSSVFFYMAAGPNRGGPLGMGAAVIELNPNYLTAKGKKYIIYTDDVIDMNPAGRRKKLFDSNKPKEIVKWVAQAHHKRMYS